MRKIIYTMAETGDHIYVTHPVRNTHNEDVNIDEETGDVTPLTDDQIEQRAFILLPPDAQNPVFVDESAVPDDRTYRMAWRLDGTSIEHDMDAARDIQKQMLRTLRQPLLDALDIKYDKADEVSDLATKQDIAAQKQVLRDVTKSADIAAATTTDQLKTAGMSIIEAAST